MTEDGTIRKIIKNHFKGSPWNYTKIYACVQDAFALKNKDIDNLRERVASLSESSISKENDILRRSNSVIARKIEKLESENERILKNKMLRSDLRKGLIYIVNEEKLKTLSKLKQIQDWGYGGIVFYSNEFPRFTEVVELKDLKKWVKDFIKKETGE